MKLSNRRIQREINLELSMTSMIDVVFLLLIFFLTTSAFVKTERNLDSTIKVERTSARPTTADLEPAIVDVAAGGSGFVFRVGERQFESADQLQQVLEQFANKSDGAYVRVADAAPFGMAAAAIQACKAARFAPVAYIPHDPDRAPAGDVP